MIAVALVVRPGAPAPDAALAALAVAGAPAPIVVRADAQLGLGVARNDALLRCDEEVLAYVEDDVAVTPGWWRALHDAWAAADATVGFMGGPIAPRVVGGRPAWLTDELLDSFALDERGDIAPQTFHGGNVAFRASGLRAAGGFWPIKGGPDARDWFSEEHLAQRSMREAGWGERWVGGMAVERLVDPSTTSRTALLRRRARYGARQQLLSGSPTALRQTLAGVGRSAVGTVEAAVRRRPDLATERAGRVAQRVGSLLGDRLVHDELQPVATRTPFRDSVPAPAPRSRHRARSKPSGAGPLAGGVVLLYHRVAVLEHDPLGLAVPPAQFDAQMARLAALGTAVPLAEAGRPGTVAVTFDDGYADNLHGALGILTAHGIPATLFASTGHIAHGTGFWWDELVRLLTEAPADAGTLRVPSGDGLRAWPAGSPEARAVTRAQLHAWLQAKLPEAIETAMRAIRAWAGRPADPAPPPRADRPLTIDELRAWADAPGMAVGAHTRTHPSLAFAPGDRQNAEIIGSRDDLRDWLGVTPTAFSYPFGIPGCDVDDTVVARVRAAGFTHAVVNTPPSSAAPEPLAIPRRVVAADGGEAFEALLAARA